MTTLEWIGRKENLVISGPSGTGKSHFTEGLAHAAIEKDLKVAWFTLETLEATLARTKVDGSMAKTAARICRADLHLDRRHRAPTRSSRRRRSVLPDYRRRIREALHRGDQQHSPFKSAHVPAKVCEAAPRCHRFTRQAGSAVCLLRQLVLRASSSQRGKG